MRFKWKKVCKFTVVVGVILGLFYLICDNISTEIFQQNNATTLRSFYRGSGRLSAPAVREDYNIFNIISTCNGTFFPLHLVRRNAWLAVSQTAYVFAAYLVETKSKVTVIGIRSGTLTKYLCQLWFQNAGKENVTMEEKYADVLPMSESHERRYTAVFFQCALSSSRTIPTHVSIVTRSCESPPHLLQIQLLKYQNPSKRKFTLCLTPLNFGYNRDYEMIEWIELNTILGAEKFFVYNYSSGINVEHVLDYYSKRGLTEVVQWKIPVGVDTWPRENKSVEIHYFGQVAALNDCLFRNKYISEFIVNLDLDEYIIPHAGNVSTWSEMLMGLKDNAKVYMFRNTFFKKEWNNAEVNISNKYLVDKFKLVTLTKLQHERKISSPRQRSKYFARTNDVSQLMIHEVPGVPHVVVPTEAAFLHHYRNWETVNDPPHVKVLDKTVPDKFGPRLIENVQKVWSDLMQKI